MMSGRDFELWQPLLALAAWIESHGAQGLLKLLQEHALATIDAGRDDSTPDADETLLRILADEIRGAWCRRPATFSPRPKQVDAAGFKTWKARGVSEHLKRYGAVTHKSCGRKVYRVTLDSLRTIQESYGVDLGFDERPGRHRAENVPYVPYVPSNRRKSAGKREGNRVHRAHRAHCQG